MPVPRYLRCWICCWLATSAPQALTCARPLASGFWPSSASAANTPKSRRASTTSRMHSYLCSVKVTVITFADVFLSFCLYCSKLYLSPASSPPCASMAWWPWTLDWWSRGRGFESHPLRCGVRPWQAAHAHLPLSPSSIVWYQLTAIRSLGLPFNGRHPRDSCNYMDHYSFTDAGGIESWVGLVGWPIADTLPTKWSHVNHR